ncbi:MAG: hydroxyacylglutathione hydrolase C-terminal domain-containing protein, partial [Planctomycetota bacterium]
YQATIIHAPGHTNDMLNFYFAELGICFVGDVLFPLGCGRLKEGTAADMWSSLQKIMRLPPQTKMYSCHEYADSNARFALSVEPNNLAIKSFYENVKTLNQNGEPSVPSLLKDELNANPFLRPHDPELRRALHMSSEQSDVEVFAKLRSMKDQF